MAMRPVTARATAIGVLLLLPMAGLALLLAVPELDVRWEHQPSHFWLVLLVAMANVALGFLTGEAAKRRADGRLSLVSLALLSSAGFLALHALATPGVLVADSNTGFTIATPIGLLLAAVFAAWSGIDLDERRLRRVLQLHRPMRLGLLAVSVAWGVASIAGAPPLDRPPPEVTPLALRLVMPVGLVLYAFGAVRYLDLYRQRRRILPLAVAIAFVLLAEAMVAVAFGRAWHATWWEWHVLMAIAFGAILWAARVEYRRERSFTEAFGGLYLERTLEHLDRRQSQALSELAAAIRADEPLSPILDRLRSDGFGTEELGVLERSARDLARIDTLFRSYVGPRLAERLARDPGLAELGGRETELTVLFADLAGFTPFSETRSAPEVVQMLNTYWEAVVPAVVEEEGGLIERFAGDAILAVFNALDDQPDHPVRAARAALAIRDRGEALAVDRPDWPRFRIGVHTGPAVIGNVGAGEQRTFSVTGDTANTAARIQTASSPGRILIGASTNERVRGELETVPVGPLELKGKRDPVEVFELVGAFSAREP